VSYISAAAKSYFVAFALAAAGTALKVYQWYFSRPLWLDEEMVLLNARDRAPSELFGELWLDQAAPVGWLALQHAVITIDPSDRAVRILPVLFGIGVIWVAWWIGRRWMTPFAAAVFVALCSIGQWITFYALEVKPYSADGFWVLSLIALAAWATEETAQRPLALTRTMGWWIAAAVGQWFSFAAIFVAPACAILLCVIAWRRAGSRTAVMVASQGLIWFANFGTQYVLSIRHASNDEFLRNYWVSGFPPAGASVLEALSWLINQAEPIAAHPGGTVFWVPFWLAVAYGAIALMRRRQVLGLLVLLVPISASLLAMLRQVPFTDRLAMWTTPPLYAAAAVAATDAFNRFRSSRLPRLVDLAMVTVATAVAWWVCADILTRGRDHIIIGGDNHGLDDGRAVRLLMRQRQPGDALLTTQHGLPAVWWYGNITIADPNAGSAFPDGAAVLELRHVWFGMEGCRRRTQMRSLVETLRGQSRAAVYLGFGSDVPEGFQQMVLDDLAKLGRRTAYTRVGSGVAAIYDLRQPPDTPLVGDAPPSKLAGCIAARRAARW
jgi:hypothetical protein